MTELKTLKDLRVEDEYMISKNDLKQEAIKWVKFYENAEYDDYEKVGLDKGTDDYYTTYATDFITHFFNLTEEDLK